MVEIEVKIVRTETIKPSSPTPDHLKKFGLSLFDQIMPETYTPLLLFYPGGGRIEVSDRLQMLKASLSEALTRFYPVAGRVVKEELIVDCDDGGVDFLETKVNGCVLSDILGGRSGMSRMSDDDFVVVTRKLLPCLLVPQSGARRALLVQANVFGCGGLVVGLGFLHVLMDACAMSAFLKAWAAAARGDLVGSAGPDLNEVALRFPTLSIETPKIESYMKYECSTGRFFFHSPQIAALRDRAAVLGGERPTRVGAVLALTMNCLVNMFDHKPEHKARPSVLGLAVNLRRWVEPPLPENSIGNMAISMFIEFDGRNEVPDLATHFRQEVKNATRNFVTGVQDSDEARMTVNEVLKKYVTLWSRDDIDFYTFSSWCGFGMCEADFGWGRPTWVGPVSSGVKNVVMMMDASDGKGIEVWVTLPEQDMTVFKTNPKFLEFASLNPCM